MSRITYLIGEASNLTGIPASTLRYYEKIGLLTKPHSQDGNKYGIRRYHEEDLRLIRFIHGLKQTGMKLEDIALFMKDGCLLTINEQEIDIQETLCNRIGILDTHIEKLEEQIRLLEKVLSTAKEKRTYYDDRLKEHEAK
ncbi:MerR family transcriptional regulator [Brevibacillus ginsengisoli]|uniref:MerR family transcriptional regulator n=1 Tax=Brevibacillus ginsengisoli TaxID=363854 RepID=UPI003CEF3441